MNRVVLMGRLTKDPEVKQGKEKAFVKFNLAVENRIGGKADFPSCIAFGKTAEVIGKYCTQGMKICVEGRLMTGSYTKENGDKVYTTDVAVDSMEFAEKKGTETDFTDVAPEETEDLPFN